MSNDRKIVAEVREGDFGSAGSRRLVRAGRIPAVVYGKKEAMHISLDAREFSHTFKSVTESTVLDLSIGKKKTQVILKDYQEDYIKGIVTHVDFYELTKGQALKANISLVLEGTPAGVREGGVLDQLLHEIEVECLPKDLVESISVDVSALELNDVLRAEDLSLSEDVKLITAEDTVVCTVKVVKEEVISDEEEQGEEVEVIGEKSSEEEADKDEE